MRRLTDPPPNRLLGIPAQVWDALDEEGTLAILAGHLGEKGLHDLARARDDEEESEL